MIYRILHTLIFLGIFLSVDAQETKKWTGATQAALERFENESTIRALVKVSPEFNFQSAEQLGVKIKRNYGGILSLEVSKTDLLALAQWNTVIQIEVGGTVVPMGKQDSVSHVASRLPEVQEQAGADMLMPYNGAGIIVGVVDVGFQLDHPTFFDTLGKHLRIKRYWDQLAPEDNSPGNFGYGKLYTDTSEMLTYIDSNDNHGTHVAGIAGGSGLGTRNKRFGGVAYDADLVFVNIKHYNDTIPSSARGDYYVANPAILDGMDYIFQYADSVGKPAVVNLSWGMHTGSHDGNSLFDQVVEQLVDSGKLFVGSAGNSGYSAIHLNAELQDDTAYTFAYDRAGFLRPVESVWVDHWGSPNTDFKIRLGLADTNGILQGITEFYPASADTTIHGILTVAKGIVGLDTLEYTLYCTGSFAGNQRPNILLHARSKSPQTRKIILSYTSTNTELHAWNSGDANTWSEGGFYWNAKGGDPVNNQYIKGNGVYTAGENGGTGKRTISVGAYSVREEWTNILGDPVNTGHQAGIRAFFSSNGPTLDGRIKPDIMAPGVEILSAYNRDAIDTNDYSHIGSLFIFRGKTHYYGSAGGTSMAGPHVAGVVALMLQANPKLTPEDALNIIHASGEENAYTGQLPNNIYGYGILNAHKAVLLAQSPLSIGDAPEKETWKLYPNPAHSELNIFHSALLNMPLDYAVTDLSGRIIKQGQSNGSLQVDDLSNGTYILSLKGIGSKRFVVLK